MVSAICFSQSLWRDTTILSRTGTEPSGANTQTSADKIRRIPRKNYRTHARSYDNEEELTDKLKPLQTGE